MKNEINYCTLLIGILSFCLVMISPIVFAADLDTLILDLEGDDEAKHVTARQLLPREGMDAVPSLLKLMEHENPEVWRTAKNVLADIGHAISIPGFEKERRKFTNQLMAVLRSDAPDWTIKHSIRLSGVVVPEGYSLKPFHDLVLNAKWREEALGALEIMGTNESRKLIEKLSRIGSVEDRVEVMEIVRLISGTVPQKLLKDSDPRIRVAAMRVLARNGTAKLVKSFEQAMSDLDETLHVEAVDAYLNLAETIMESGNHRDEGLAIFRRILETESAAGLRGGALAGLGRYGDESVVATILKATQGEGGDDLEAPALMALGSLHGRDSYTAMLKAYPNTGEDMKLGLLGVFGRTQDPIFREVLETAVKSSDNATQIAAEQALKQFNLPPGINTAEASHPPQEKDSGN